MVHLESDVLVIGAGGAGMYAAIAAAREGCTVNLIDRSLIGRGGATVMAQMTVAAAIGEQVPDDWTHHYKDTLTAGRGLCNEPLARLLCEDGPTRIREMEAWKVGWARENGHIKQVAAPGHDRARCVYVDFLNTGPAVSKTLRTRLQNLNQVRRIGDLTVVDLVVKDSEVLGAVALHLNTGQVVTLAAKSVIVATGGLTRLYWRNSASFNMGGDGFALALRAGAELIDMEFVQFFPIGHLAPRMIGMDPIMWDPFRYKLGGRLLNADKEEFGERYGQTEDGNYVLTRDVATYAIFKENEAGRGSPHGGAYLSFEHIPEAELRRNFGPVIDRLAANGIDLTKMPIEVAPIAHYHMGGIRVDADLQTKIGGLLAAGEAVGGANGANRLSGNAITEALVFGHRAGTVAAARARKTGGNNWDDKAAQPIVDFIASAAPRGDRPNPARLVPELQTLMQEKVGPFRTGAKLEAAIDYLLTLRDQLGDVPFAGKPGFDTEMLDWLDLRNMQLVGETIARAALARVESRGAHQREDHPGLKPNWELNQAVRLRDGHMIYERLPVVRAAAAKVA